MLISAGNLASHLGDGNWIVVDCRFNLGQPAAGRKAWEAGHIPGAFYADLNRDLASPVGPASGRHPLPDPTRLNELFHRWGVEPGSRVVAYDDAGGAMAARLWWLLRWMGHGGAMLLDGGWPAWQSAGLPVATQDPPARAGGFAGSPGHMPTGDAAAVLAGLASEAQLLLDARAPARFRGEQETIDPVAGHVPGAVNAPFQDNLTTDGRFRSPAELRQRFTALAAGRTPARLTCMCGSGVTACHNLFALELAGMAGARLYNGSWSEWIRDPQRPVACGDGRASK